MIDSEYAALIAGVELFAGVDRVALARLAGYVEPIAMRDGQLLFAQGDLPDALYIVARGSLGIFASGANDDTEARLNTLFPGDCVGEMGLITDEPRSATVRAEGESTVLRLGRDQFVEIVRQEPAVANAVTTILSHRLRAADQARVQGDAAFQRTVEATLGRLGPAQRRQVLTASLLSDRSLHVLDVVFGDDANDVERILRQLGIAAEPTAALRLLQTRCTQEIGTVEVQRFLQEAGERLAAAGLWDPALDAFSRQPGRARFADALGDALHAIPPLEGERAERWIGRLREEDVAGDPELALAAAAYWEERQAPDVAVHFLQRALGAALVSSDATAGQRLTAEIARLSGSRLPTAPAAGGARRRLLAIGERRPSPRSTLAIAGAAGLVVAAATLGANHTTLAFILLLGAAIALWNSNLFPDFAVSLALVAAWIVWGIAEPAQAVAGFASMDWLFVLAVLGIAVAIARSGLLFRAGLLLVRRTPRSLLGQAAILLGTGILLGPLLPESRGRAALTGPLALAVAQAARLRDGEPAAALLGLAAWIGAGPLMFLFLNASSVCLLGWGLLPDRYRAQFDWLSWLVAALPLGIFVSLGTLAVLFLVLRPTEALAVSRERLNTQLAVLGPLSPRERSMLVVLIATVLGWFAAPALHLHVGVVAIFGLFAAVATGSFDRQSFREMDWDFLIYYGGALSIAKLSAAVGLTGQGGTRVDTLEQGSLLVAHPLIFVLLTGAASLLVRLALEHHQAVLLLSLMLIPLALAVDINPWVVVVTLLATNNSWLLRAQTPSYLVAYTATEGRLYTHTQARRVAVAHAAITLVALALAVPYWHLLGLL